MHVITPTQAEFMMDLRKHRLEAHKGASAAELANADRSESMVRKLAMNLSRCNPPYVVSQNSSELVTVGGKRKTISFARYYLSEDTFVRWPRTAALLLECKRFRLDQNGNIAVPEFVEHLKQNCGFSGELFKEDWEFVRSRGYVHEYPSGVSPGRRIDAEEQWLELLARLHRGATP